jgi:hypothetical protein
LKTAKRHLKSWGGSIFDDDGNKGVVSTHGRARIVITTRPIPIDQQLIERHLPIPRATEAAATAEEFADVAMSRQRQHRSNAAEPKLWRNVALMPLSRDQIRDFAIVQGVTNPDEVFRSAL